MPFAGAWIETINDMTKDQKVILEFMKATVERVNRCMSDTYAIQKLLIEKNIISEKDLNSRLKDAQSLPQAITGRKVLEDMIKNFQPEGASNEKENHGPVLETRRDTRSSGGA
jgi:hypothetical protein